MIVHALAAGPDTLLSGVTVTVTGRGIPEPLVFALPAIGADGQASTTVTMPAGPNRTFVGRGFIDDVLSHQGTQTVDVTTAGVTIQLALEKLTGEGSIGTSIEDFHVLVDSAAAGQFDIVADTTTAVAVAAGDTADLSAGVFYATSAADGSYVKDDPVSGAVVTWASENPGILTVGATTCTTATESIAGSSVKGVCGISISVSEQATSGQTVAVVASHKGIAHRVTVTVR